MNRCTDFQKKKERRSTQKLLLGQDFNISNVQVPKNSRLKIR